MGAVHLVLESIHHHWCHYMRNSNVTMRLFRGSYCQACMGIVWVHLKQLSLINQMGNFAVPDVTLDIDNTYILGKSIDSL